VQECNDPVFGSCSVTTPDDCAAAGGDYQGDDTLCVQPNGTTLSLNATPGLAIPDGTSTFVCSTIDLVDPANCDAVSDLDVRTKITHTWIADLTVDVTGPTGLTSNIFANVCGNTDNMDYWFDDEGTDNTCVAVQTGGRLGITGFGPPMSQYDGTNPEGTWELCVADSFGLDSGTLDLWSVEIDCGSEVCVFLPTPEPSCDPTPTPEPTATPTPDTGHGHGHGGKGGHGWWWGWDDGGDGTAIGLEAFGDASNGDAIDPVINSRPRSHALSGGSDRGPRAPVGDRLPR
jgi:subtilisin-like proprotein convertase family protein